MAETVGIVGAGALGTLLATRLAHAGHAVHVLARSPARREALHHDASRMRVEERMDGLKPATLVFVCVKSYDTRAAAQAIAASGIASAIGSLQNGWGNMEQLQAGLPASPLIAGATALGAFFDERGALHASTEGVTWFAPWGETDYRWAEYAETLFESAGFRAEASRDGPQILWRKLALNAAVNPVSALSGLTNGAILESEPLLRSAEAAVREAARVGACLGYLDPRVDPIPGLHDLLRETAGNRSSMAEDLARGRRTEIDSIVGAIVREAQGLGEHVPELTRLWEGVRAKDGGTREQSG